jgi:hypothetical protein
MVVTFSEEKEVLMPIFCSRALSAPPGWNTLCIRS